MESKRFLPIRGSFKGATTSLLCGKWDTISHSYIIDKRGSSAQVSTYYVGRGRKQRNQLKSKRRFVHEIIGMEKSHGKMNARLASVHPSSARTQNQWIFLRFNFFCGFFHYDARRYSSRQAEKSEVSNNGRYIVNNRRGIHIRSEHTHRMYNCMEICAFHRRSYSQFSNIIRVRLQSDTIYSFVILKYNRIVRRSIVTHSVDCVFHIF